MHYKNKCVFLEELADKGNIKIRDDEVLILLSKLVFKLLLLNLGLKLHLKLIKSNAILTHFITISAGLVLVAIKHHLL